MGIRTGFLASGTATDGGRAAGGSRSVANGIRSPTPVGRISSTSPGHFDKTADNNKTAPRAVDYAVSRL